MKRYRLLLVGMIWTSPLVGQSAVSNTSLVPTPEIYLIGSVHNMHFEERYHLNHAHNHLATPGDPGLKQ
jgi:hypothetical protein